MFDRNNKEITADISIVGLETKLDLLIKRLEAEMTNYLIVKSSSTTLTCLIGQVGSGISDILSNVTEIDGTYLYGGNEYSIGDELSELDVLRGILAGNSESITESTLELDGVAYPYQVAKEDTKAAGTPGTFSFENGELEYYFKLHNGCTICISIADEKFTDAFVEKRNAHRNVHWDVVRLKDAVKAYTTLDGMMGSGLTTSSATPATFPIPIKLLESIGGVL